MSDKYSKVTICVPVRNGGKTIRKTLDSLLSQDYPNYEIIVSDNCSDDNTAEIVKSYAKFGVKYFFNPKLERWGESNWNFILTLAEGPFVALYHADDIYKPSIVGKQVEFLQNHPDVVAVFTMSERIDRNSDNPVKIGPIELPKELKGKEIFYYDEFLNYTLKYGTFVVVPTMMTRKEVIEKVGLFRPEKYATASDIDLYLRMAKIGPIGVIDEKLHQYRIGSLATQKLFHQRTFRQHFFDVLDDYVADESNKSIIKEECLSIYTVLKAADMINVAINMIINNQRSAAKEILKNALSAKNIVLAFHYILRIRRKRLLIFLVGLFINCSFYLRLDRSLSILFSKFEKIRSDFLLSPITKARD